MPLGHAAKRTQTRLHPGLIGHKKIRWAGESERYWCTLAATAKSLRTSNLARMTQYWSKSWRRVARKLMHKLNCHKLHKLLAKDSSSSSSYQLMRHLAEQSTQSTRSYKSLVSMSMMPTNFLSCSRFFRLDRLSCWFGSTSWKTAWKPLIDLHRTYVSLLCWPMLIPCLHLRSPRFLFLFLSAPLEELLMVLTLVVYCQPDAVVYWKDGTSRSKLIW